MELNRVLPLLLSPSPSPPRALDGAPPLAGGFPPGHFASAAGPDQFCMGVPPQLERSKPRVTVPLEPASLCVRLLARARASSSALPVYHAVAEKPRMFEALARAQRSELHWHER